MNRKNILLLVSAALLLLAFASGLFAGSDDTGEITVTIVYDNYDLIDSNLEEDWGFAAIIRGFDKVVLFDTGTNGKIFMGNLEKAGVDPSEIKIVILSHEHQDHIGGLQAFLSKNHDVKVYVPASFKAPFKKLISDSGATCIEVKENMEILPGLFSTGEMGEAIIEQSLFFNCEKGRGLITGCAHPGIERIVSRVYGYIGKDVNTVIGGFHLMQASEERLATIQETFSKAGVHYLLATHCTGDKAKAYFQKSYGERFINKGLSQTITILK